MQEIINNKELQKKLADQVHDMMLGKLYDIEGIDSVNWLPLAPGWWILIIIISLFLIKELVSFLRMQAYRQSWQYSILCELDQLHVKLCSAKAKEVLIKLSEILRRLAIYKFSRTECAGLEGEAWLKWLKQNDTCKFDWEKKGGILIEAIYACPKNTQIPLKELNNLINATKKWVI